MKDPAHLKKAKNKNMKLGINTLLLVALLLLPAAVTVQGKLRGLPGRRREEVDIPIFTPSSGCKDDSAKLYQPVNRRHRTMSGCPEKKDEAYYIAAYGTPPPAPSPATEEIEVGGPPEVCIATDYWPDYFWKCKLSVL
jgi:hypothetical protein